MSFYLTFSWVHFSIAFGAMLLLTFIMSLQSKSFYTRHIIVRKFSILDLQFPASPQELVNYIKGIFQLSPSLTNKVLKNLKGQLYVDFLYMIAAYGSIFILCMKVSMKMTSFGQGLFATLAWLQVISFLCDIIENIYLLKKIKPEPIVSKLSIHKTMQIVIFSKWIIALTAAVCSLAAMGYFWLVGRFSYNSLEYLVLIISELALFIIIQKATAKNNKKEVLQAFSE